MTAGIIGISITGLNAAQAALRTTQHNISNANTPGFHRQQVQLATQPPSYTGAGYFGNGVNVAAVTRAYSQFLDQELHATQGQLARNQVYATYASQIDRLLGDRDSGLSTALSAFFGAVGEVANDPTSMAARQTLLAAGRNLAGRVNNLGGVLDGMRQGINQEMAVITDQVNAYARQIAALNDDIAASEARGGTIANDLRDQREQLTAELNTLVNVTVVNQTDGTYNVYIGAGQPLVIGNLAGRMAVVDQPGDPSLKVPALVNNNLAIPFGADAISGGRLGGLLAMREEVLLPAQNELGRIAIAIADQFNDQHRAGYGIADAVQRAFFASEAGMLRQPAAYASNSSANPPDIAIALADSDALTGSDYLLSFDGANYNLVRLSDNQAVASNLAPGATATVDGFSLTVDAGADDAPVAGDRWLIRPTADGALSLAVALADARHIAAAQALDATGTTGAPGDNRNALALAELQTSPLMSNGTATFQGTYNQLVSQTASLASEADIGVAAYETLSQQALESQQSLSGVNLDEEAANLIRFQQAYQASARALQVATGLFDEILAIGR
ncbi:MAG: flagellar hook-associated protein FlgK [Thiobacillaceae bacterium]|nr:flagellar hook-associated protein FlgK [Thiobacillaceae bacterium]